MDFNSNEKEKFIKKNYQKIMEKDFKIKEHKKSKNKITIIIPTIGRETLERSIQSVLNQSCPKWELIVIFDGVEPTYNSDNENILILKLKNKAGSGKNCAGDVRNFGMQFATTKYIGFLDDDDILSPLYVKKVLNEFKEKEKEQANIDLLIFRMYDENRKMILPNLDQTNFFLNKVGISFVIKRKIFDMGYKFIPSSREDFSFIDKLRKNNHKIMISPFIMYFVKPHSLQIPLDIACKTGKRSIIN